MSRTSVSGMLVGGEIWGEGEQTFSMASVEIPWFVRQKKPSVSAAWISSFVISSMRDSKSWREMRGVVRVVYFEFAIV
jgi:hypothetical protein